MLASIAAYQDSKFEPGKGKRWGRAGAWCIVHQAVIRGWYQRLYKRFERPAGAMCRRTLQYHLAALRRLGHLVSEQRHTGVPRSNKLDLNPSIYKFTARGRQWISRRAGWVENPAALSAAQKIAQRGFNPDLNSSTSLSSAVDKAPTARGASRRGKGAALTRRTSSSTSGRARQASAAARPAGQRRSSRAETPRTYRAPAPRTRQASAPRKAAGQGASPGSRAASTVARQRPRR